MALSGSVAVKVTQYNNLIFSWSAAQSALDNRSTVSWQLLLEAKQYGQIASSALGLWTVTMDAQVFNGVAKLTVAENQTKVLASGQVTLAHDEEGRRSFDFSFSQMFGITFDGQYIDTVSGEGTATLDTIPRASQPTLSAETLAFGQGLTIYTGGVSSYTHTLEYSFGNASGVVARGVGDSYLWVPDMELARQIPDSVSGTLVITCTTYVGDIPIGSKQATALLTLPEDILPTVSALWSDTSGAYETVGSLVQNVSKLAVEVSGTGIYGSTVTGAAVTLDGKAYGGGYLTDSGERSLTVSVTDSRGRVGTATYPLAVAAYRAPGVTLSASRYDDDGNPDDTGGWAKITVGCAVTPLEGRNSGTLQLQWGDQGEQVEVGTGEVVYQKTVKAGVNETLPITAVLTDRLVSSSRSMVLSTGYVTLDLLAGGRGISLGRVADREGFDCGMEACFRKGIFQIHADGTVDSKSLFDRVAALEARQES